MAIGGGRRQRVSGDDRPEVRRQVGARRLLQRYLECAERL